MEWEKEAGISDSFYFIRLDTTKWVVALGHAELVLGSTYTSLTMMIPRNHKKEYVHQFTTSDKPTVIYTYENMEGNDIIDHWNTWTAIEGTKAKSILHVSNTKVSGKKTTPEKDECKAFMELPKSLAERKHISVVIEGTLCKKVPKTYRVIIGKYKKIDHKGLHTTKTWIPTDMGV